MRLTLTLCIVLSVSACAKISQSRFNPLNWFGPSETIATATPRNELRPLISPSQQVQVVEGRVLIAQITGLQIDRTPNGAIITARGLAATPGHFNAQLVRRGFENGVLTFDFRVEAPSGFEAAGSEAARQITVATSLEGAELAGVRSVIVNGQSGSRRASR